MTALIEALAPLASLTPVAVLPAAVVFTRLSLLVFLMPGLGARVVPSRVKLVVALALTALLTPLVARDVPTEAALPLLLAGEAMAGAYLGFSFRVLVFALSIAGTIIAQALSLSQIFGAGISEDSSTTVSTLLTLAAMTLFLTAGLHIEAFGLLLDSYEAFPPGLGGHSGGYAQAALRACADGFAFGLSLAAPFVLMNLAYNAVLGLASRAMPQLMVTFVGMPAITFAGLALLAAGAGLILTVWMDRMGAVFAGVLP